MTNYGTVYCALRVTEQFVTSCELKNSFLCPPNYEVVSCVLKITNFCALRIKEQFTSIVPSELQNSLLYPLNNETAFPPYSGTAFVPFDLRKQFLVRCDFRKSLLRPPNHGTIFRVSRIIIDRVLFAALIVVMF